MNTLIKIILTVALLIARESVMLAQGYIVPNGVGYSVNGIGYYGISVVRDPTNGFTTGFELIGLGKTPQTSLYTNTFGFSPIVDVGVRVFLVGSNQPISLSPILLNSYVELGSAPSYVFNSGVSFYVGLYTGNQNFAPPNGIYTDPLFGWARLRNNQGVIELMDSALSYKSQGIFAGTTTLIPEPTSIALLLLSGGLIAARRYGKMET